MNQDLAQIVICYATRPHHALSALLLNKSKDNLISILTDLLTAYINDKNSSSLREFVTVSIAGYQHNPNKLGYNGYKQNSAIGGKPTSCEAKPKNIQTDRYEQKKTKAKLSDADGFNYIEFVQFGKAVDLYGFPFSKFFPNIQNHPFCCHNTLFANVRSLKVSIRLYNQAIVTNWCC